ncbi:MAG: primosomal protein N' [Planctomycetes bacterium]|nr:primosomal protein N' [Planctomycetota bacterium]
MRLRLSAARIHNGRHDFRRRGAARTGYDTADMSSLFTARIAGESHRYAHVALEQGLEKPGGLTYLIPDTLHDLRVGDRVIVPLGRNDRPVSGYVLNISDDADVDPLKLKAIASKDRLAVNLPDDLVELARWVSRYYCCPLGMVFATMLPAAVKKGIGLVRKTYVDLHDPIATIALASIVHEHGLKGKQADVLGVALEMARLGKMPVDPKTLAHAAGAKSISPVTGLIERGLLKQIVKTEVQAIWAEHAVEENKHLTLNDDQQKVLDAIAASLDGAFAALLLHGVTGSGKTEVYIRAIEEVVKRGKRAIVLVPEIALTPQTVGRFIGRFKHVAVLHSGLTAAQRHQQWTLIRDGWANVIVGARSAIFAPVDNLGLIVVDEEHDGSYKQDNAPRYHARDVAVKRAQMLGATVLMGSATPALESYYNATTRGAYKLLSLPKRVSQQPLPRVEIVDLLDERRKRSEYTGKGGIHLLSVKLEQLLRQTFKDGGQAMLLLNRRGFANYIACPDHRCGWIMKCEHCDANMVYHVSAAIPSGGLVRCHYCGFENRQPTVCPVCSRKVTMFGLGTQRVELEIERKFPDVKFARMDSDAMRTATDYAQVLDAFKRGEIRLLVGTQMIAKGLDFPNVRLVGVISADTALSLPDFRAAERTFQMVCQVAGRSGRSTAGGRVVIQTFTPAHPAIALAAMHDYVKFAADELAHRKRAKLPPITRMARLIVRDEALEKAQAEATKLAGVIRAVKDDLNLEASIVGPTPAPISRIGGYHRQQIEIAAENAAVIQQLLAAARSADLLRSDARTAVDVDPISLM